MDLSIIDAALQLAVNKYALFSAVKANDTVAVVNLLDRGVPIDSKAGKGLSLMHWAAECGSVATVRLLIRKGCDVDSVDNEGYTPLHLAATNGQTKAVQELIRNGASKSVVDSGCETPLHLAVMKGHVNTAIAMLEEGCPLDLVNGDGETVMHFAASYGCVEIMKVLADKGCDMNAVDANGATPLHAAVITRRIETVNELMKLGAMKSVVAGDYGTPLHQAVGSGSLETVGALLECETSESDLTKHYVTPSNSQVSKCSLLGTCNSFGQTPVIWAVRRGHVEVFKLLISKGGSVSDRDDHSLSTLEQCFVGGHANKLRQFCEACGIRNLGEGLRGALSALITQGLVNAQKVLCLCAITGDCAFLEEQFAELVVSDAIAMPAAVKCAKYYFREGQGVPFINQLCMPDENAMYPLHIALLSLKCFSMGFAGSSIQFMAKDHTSFITKLLSHPVSKETVHENFPNGLSPLDLAQQFELHDIAALIEWAGGGPGVWADIPQEVAVKHPLALARLKEAYASIKAIAEDDGHGLEFIESVFSSVLRQPICERSSLLSVEQLGKETILRQKPKLSKLARIILSEVSTQSWMLVGLLLLENIADCKETLKAISHQFSDDRNRFLETLSYWLENGSNVAWKTLLDVLGHFETKHCIDKLTGKIVSELGGAHQTVAVNSPFRPVTSSAPVVSEGAVAAERSPPVCEAKQVLAHFRDQFIAEMDANSVMYKLLHKDVISRGVMEKITKADGPDERNEILHDWLQRTCDKEALMEVCYIITAVKGNPKMKEFGKAMKRKLERDD